MQSNLDDTAHSYLIEQWSRARADNKTAKADTDLNTAAIEHNVHEWADRLLERAWTSGDHATYAECMRELIELIATKRLHVDYQHSATAASALMCASAAGDSATVDTLIGRHRANVFLKSHNELTALDWARRCFKSQCVECIELYQ